MIERLQARLADLAASGQTITYGALARELGLSGSGVIAQLTSALELLMTVDANQNAPFRASLCCGRLNGDLPALGFFEKATALGLYDGSDANAFVAAHRQRLFNAPA